MQGKRTLFSDGGQILSTVAGLETFKAGPKPDFIDYRQQSINLGRVKMFTNIQQRIKIAYEALEKPPITVTLKDGKKIEGQSFLTTPFVIAKGISKNLAESCIVARVKYTKRHPSPFNAKVASAEAEDEAAVEANGWELIDMSRPLEGDCDLELLSFDDKEGKQVFWHSSSHLLGQSLENNYGAWLCHGPPLDNGFFYDCYLGPTKLSQTDYDTIEKEVRKYVQDKEPYERILLTKNQALELFQYNPFKVQLIQAKVPADGYTSAYRCGNLIDLCTGPHLPSADRVKGFKVTKNSSAYWLGKKDNPDLQRVYAISFPKQALLDQYVKAQEELAKRDHRNVGPKQGLFNFTTLAPGCALFYQHGAIIYNRLIELMRSEYRIRGYGEVISPNIYNSELWMMSGHYFKYKENIFFFQNEGEENGLKPMNCPGHCVMFSLNQRSYRDLPLRMADFGVLHRNQLHGALSGLTRVRRFQQDDAHIFCRPDQIQDQILGVLDLLDYIYTVFGFRYGIELSTRPEKYLGELADWDKAQAQLKAALEKFGKTFTINAGDGAFYGPKIDFKLYDVFGREHQCGTVQLDFQLPARFNLQYRSRVVQQVGNGEEEPAKGQNEEKPEKKKAVKLSEEEIEAKRREKAEQKKQKAVEAPPKETEGKPEEIKPEAPKAEEKKLTLAELEEKYSKLQPVKNGFERPVIIHRAIYGSLERFIAILCEHTGGKWDFWVSPRQLQIIPVGKQGAAFAEKVYNSMLLHNYSVSIDDSGDKLDKKIRNAQLMGYNFIGVIGNEEVASKSITLRKRDQEEAGEQDIKDKLLKLTIPELIKMFGELKPPKSKRRIQIEANTAA